MSIAKILFDGIGWGEFSHIILFLNLNELWILGQCNKFAFITFLKEKSFRRSENFKNVMLTTMIKLINMLIKIANSLRLVIISYE